MQNSVEEYCFLIDQKKDGIRIAFGNGIGNITSSIVIIISISITAAASPSSVAASQQQHYQHQYQYQMGQ